MQMICGDCDSRTVINSKNQKSQIVDYLQHVLKHHPAGFFRCFNNLANMYDENGDWVNNKIEIRGVVSDLPPDPYKIDLARPNLTSRVTPVVVVATKEMWDKLEITPEGNMDEVKNA